MNKTILSILVFACASAFAQERGDYLDRYNRLVKNVGEAGVGVEYLLDRWAEAWPDDCNMLEARYSYYLAKSRSETVEKMDTDRYLGEKPMLSLKDSLGRNVNYFMVPVYNDSLFRMSQQCIDRAIALEPNAIVHRFHKISALAAYEKDSPDMASTALLDLIDMDAARHPEWVFNGEPVSREDFNAAVQEYCIVFYKTGSQASYESFRVISERMLKLEPRNTLFMNNLGAYWQVARKDDRAASKYYKKVLKLNPDDATAKTNMGIIRRNKQKTNKK